VRERQVVEPRDLGLEQEVEAGSEDEQIDGRGMVS
jgi:hypothetical protein